MNMGSALLAYVNKWVALTQDKKAVVASASDLKRLDNKVKKDKLKDVIYHFVLPHGKSFSP